MLFLHISILLHSHSRNRCSVSVDPNVLHIGGDANPLELRNSTPTLDIVLSTGLLNLGPLVPQSLPRGLLADLDMWVLESSESG